jgi:hypothetical protein
MNGSTSTTSVPNVGGNLDVKLTFGGIASFRLYRCVQQADGTWVVDVVLEQNGHGDTSAPASYSCAPPSAGGDILLYLQILLSAVVVPADVSCDISVGRGATTYSQTHIPAHVASTAVPAEARLQFHGT